MSKADFSYFKEPQRQSLLGIVVYLLRSFRALTTLLLTIIALAAANPKLWYFLGFGIIPLALAFGVLAYFQHRNFTFHVRGDELIIHKGVLVKDRIVVDVDRIQSIQITENIVQRMLGLVALKVDTAGSKGNELEIPALERPKANELKALLYQKKAAQNVGEEAREEGATPADPFAEAEGETLVKLGVFDLLLVGLTENHLRTGLIAVAFVFGTMSQYQELIERYFSDSVDEYAQQAINAGITLILSAIILFTVLSVIISLVRTVLRFYNLKAVLKSQAVEISTGLLKRNEFRVPIRKVQFVLWQTNPLRRAVGYESATLKPSNSVGEVANKQSIEIPALKKAESAMLATGIFENYMPPVNEIHADAAAYARLAAIISSLILLPALGLIYWFHGYSAFLLLIPILLITSLAYIYGRTVRIFFDQDYVLIKKGWAFTSRAVLPSFKIQALSRKDNVFLARRNLCHISFYTAAGTRSVRYLDATDAKNLYDYLLYCTEKSNESWM